MAMTEKLWVFIKQETHAPDNLCLCPLFCLMKRYRNRLRMVFQFPSEDAPDNALQISIGNASTRWWNQEMMLWALGTRINPLCFPHAERTSGKLKIPMSTIFDTIAIS
jgi:hypothetical protein